MPGVRSPHRVDSDPGRKEHAMRPGAGPLPGAQRGCGEDRHPERDGFELRPGRRAGDGHGDWVHQPLEYLPGCGAVSEEGVQAMMTREEASAQIEGLKKYCEDMADSDESGAYVFDLDVQALDIALSALRPVSREQVERMAGEWVQDINKGPAVFYCSSCGESFEIHSYEFQKYRFCPFCMSPMTDEAVQMVLERLEAMKDGL